jgi:hypothetical protein
MTDVAKPTCRHLLAIAAGLDHAHAAQGLALLHVFNGLTAAKLV